jgi:hypothetical protein
VVELPGWKTYRSSEAEAWSAAAEFTRDRLEQIRQLEAADSVRHQIALVDYERDGRPGLEESYDLYRTAIEFGLSGRRAQQKIRCRPASSPALNPRWPTCAREHETKA